MKLRRTELFGATAIIGGALIAFACSGGEDYPSYLTGGSTGTPTGNTGGTTGGAAPATGGVASSTGGTVSSTGGTLSTGGTISNTGGTISNAGGTLGTGGSASSGKGGGLGTGGKSGTGTGGKSGTGTGGKSGGTGGSGGKAGTGGSGGGTGTVAYSQVVAFIRTNCGSCHAGAEAPNLNTQNPTTLYTTLTTVTVRQCGGNKLVTANDPSKSALLMVGTDKCSGLKMPAGCMENNCYDASDVTLLTTWIQQGAKNP